MDYRCPGENYLISQAQHLQRMARGYAACATCRHRTEVGSLTVRQRRQVTHAQERQQPQSLFGKESVGGIIGEELTSHEVHRLGEAFAEWICQEEPASDEAPSVLVAHDDLPTSIELMADAVRGLRERGVRVIDVGAVTSPCLMLAIEYQQACGGLLVSNPDGEAHRAQIHCYGPRGICLSQGGELDAIRDRFSAGDGHLTRQQPAVTRKSIESPYLAPFREAALAIGPSRVVLATRSRAIRRWLTVLLEESHCDLKLLDLPAGIVIDEPGALDDELRRATNRYSAQLGVWIDSVGERIEVLDAGGRKWTQEEMVVALATDQLRSHGSAAVVAAPPLSSAAVATLHEAGGRLATEVSTRQTMYAAMQQHAACFGSDTSHRYWFPRAIPVPDALQALLLMLRIGSEQRGVFSPVDDVAKPMGMLA